MSTASSAASPRHERSPSWWLLGCSIVAFVIVALALLWLGGGYGYYRYHATRRHVEKLLPALDPVIAALEAYHRRTGHYPEKLDQLSIPLPVLPQPPFRNWGRDRGYYYSRFVEQPYDSQRLNEAMYWYNYRHGRNPARLSELPPYFPEGDTRNAALQGPPIDPHPGHHEETYRIDAWLVRKHDSSIGWMEWLTCTPDGYRPERDSTKPWARIGRWGYCTEWD